MHARTRGELGQGARIAAILTAFGDRDELIGPSELARRTGLARSTAHRLAHDLADAGLLERVNGRMRPGPLLLTLARRVVVPQALRDAAAPLMADLREAVGLGVALAVLDGADVVCVESLQVAGAPATPRRGDRRPALDTAAGRAILAFSPRERAAAALAAGVPGGLPRPMLARHLDRVRKDGVAYDVREPGRGTVRVAAPVLGPDGRAVAALSVPCRGGRDRAERAASAVRATSLTLSRVLRPA
ncbi:IclR family transcriptional regulator [Actinocorallia sp. API 0066]|uniref:IclR family transcriptional regulator n=1 Tax=Actinocorallia sp. API 0066 TaxID=2896846 RepID=UPI001E457020|nr:IclR family transcriptional regulator [Actinocorallia sp. API 0066]MCD0449827.1 IclR family transcriptional regulator [Actinocorallia sp. API 0066]